MPTKNQFHISGFEFSYYDCQQDWDYLTHIFCTTELCPEWQNSTKSTFYMLAAYFKFQCLPLEFLLLPRNTTAVKQPLSPLINNLTKICLFGFLLSLKKYNYHNSKYKYFSTSIWYRLNHIFSKFWFKKKKYVIKKLIKVSPEMDGWKWVWRQIKFEKTEGR